MKRNNAHWIIWPFTILILLISFLFLRDFGYLNGWSEPIDSKKFADWGSTISGLMATGAFIFAFITFLNQAKSSSKQEVENNYFKLIENLQFIINQINIAVPPDNEVLIADLNDKIKWKVTDKRNERVDGREALRIIMTKLKNELTTLTIDDLFDKTTDRKIGERNYQEFYDKYFYILGHYFRYVYNIIKYIDSSDSMNKIEKIRLTDLLQAQLSSDEMGLIFYNAIFNEKAKKKLTGERKFLELLEKYKLLENIDDKSLADSAHKKKYYPNTFN